MRNPLSNSGKVLKLYVSREGDLSRSDQQEISVDENGVIGDKFYAKEPNRSILLSSIDSYTMAQEQSIDMPYGSLGENILLSYSPYTIPVGEEFRIGEVILVITQNCTLCKSLTKVDSRLPKLLKDDRGIFAKVVKGGIIKIGDTIETNQKETE